MVFIVGEPGIGKSRLVYEFHRRVGTQAGWTEGRCVAFGRSIPFHPLIDLLRRKFAIEDGDDEQTVIGKIEAVRTVSVVNASDSLGKYAKALKREIVVVTRGKRALAALVPLEKRRPGIARAEHAPEIPRPREEGAGRIGRRPKSLPSRDAKEGAAARRDASPALAADGAGRAAAEPPGRWASQQGQTYCRAEKEDLMSRLSGSSSRRVSLRPNTYAPV